LTLLLGPAGQKLCLVDKCDSDFTAYSGYDGTWSDSGSFAFDGAKAGLHLDTHSYLGLGAFTTVYPAFDEIRKMFDPKN